MSITNDDLERCRAEFKAAYKMQMKEFDSLIVSYRSACNKDTLDALTRLGARRPVNPIQSTSSSELIDAAAQAIGCMMSLSAQNMTLDNVDEPHRWSLPVMDELMQRSIGAEVLYWGIWIEAAAENWYSHVKEDRTRGILPQLAMVRGITDLRHEGLKLICGTNRTAGSAMELIAAAIESQADTYVSENAPRKLAEYLVKVCGILSVCRIAFASSVVPDPKLEVLAIGLLTDRAGCGLRPSRLARSIASIGHLRPSPRKSKPEVPQDLAEVRSLILKCESALVSSLQVVASRGFDEGIEALVSAGVLVESLAAIERH